MGRALLTTPADIGQQFANFIQGNPGNVLGQPQGMDQIRGLLGSPTSDAQDVGEALGPPMKLAGKALGLISGKLPAMLAAHIAYHGSPYQFDKFDMSKIGTGEGAQAYGHGLYFAENPDIAKSYQQNLGGNQYLVGGQPVGTSGALKTPQAQAAAILDQNGGDLAGTKAMVDKFVAQKFWSQAQGDSISAALDDVAARGVSKQPAGSSLQSRHQRRSRSLPRLGCAAE